MASSTSPSATAATTRSEEHTSELQSLMRISYAVFCLKKKKQTKKKQNLTSSQKSNTRIQPITNISSKQHSNYNKSTKQPLHITSKIKTMYHTKEQPH